MKKIKNSLAIRIVSIFISIAFVCPNLAYCQSSYKLRPAMVGATTITLPIQLPEPVQLVRQHARAFKKEIQPIMANVQLMLEDLKSEKPLSKDNAEKLQEVDDEIAKSGEIIARFRDKLEVRAGKVERKK